MSRPNLTTIFLLLSLSGLAVAQSQTPLSDGLKVFKTGDYATAIPLLKAPASKEQEVLIRSALLEALVYQRQTDEAADLAKSLEAQFPTDPTAMTARAELLYYLGDLMAADKLFRAALQVNPKEARAHLGLHRLLRAASFYRSARLSCLRAHSLDPEDALITLTFMRYLVPEKRREQYGPFMESHPWFAKDFERGDQFVADIHKQLAEQKPFELQGNKEETTLRLVDLLAGAKQIRGFGLELSVENNRPLRLLLDTGASGILISQKAADKAGLKHVGSFESGGIGDSGPRQAFGAIASTCKVGKLEYKNCIFQSLEGKGKIAGDEDGLIGTDFFSDYLIHLDFQRHEMKLTPLPARSPDPQGYDRVTPDGEADFTPIFRYGHMLMIPTKVNGKSTGLFLIDTGAGISNIDSSFARLSTKLHGDDYMHVRGVSGKVKDVFEADKAELEFGRFRQRNLGLTAFNINNSTHRQEVRMSGILGLPLLVMFRLDLDYRNGLVKFDYVLK